MKSTHNLIYSWTDPTDTTKGFNLKFTETLVGKGSTHDKVRKEPLNEFQKWGRKPLST